MESNLRILMLEDVMSDAELEVHTLNRAGVACDYRRVQEEADFVAELDGFEPHVIISDFTLPAFDGLSALEAARRYRPEVVLLDIGMPGMDGYEVAMRLRAQPEFRALSLAAITGYGQGDDRRRSREAGFDHHFTKPVDPGALREFLASVHRP